eukprot:1161476-Pelagomonas_calceolata.AAC.4
MKSYARGSHLKRCIRKGRPSPPARHYNPPALYPTGHLSTQDSKPPKPAQFGVVVGLERKFGDKKVGFTPRLVWQVLPNVRL